MREAFAAWKAATKFLFWGLIASVTNAILINRIAAREETAFKPGGPAELFASGYVAFFHEINFDSWLGYWRPENAVRGQPIDAGYQVIQWNGVPYHCVSFSNWSHDKREIRAVSKEYADKYLRRFNLMKEAA